MIFNKWTTKKPEFDKECLLTTAHTFRGEWEYNIYQIKKIVFDDKWYWGLLTGDGEENDSLEDLTAQKYLVLPLLKNKNP